VAPRPRDHEQVTAATGEASQIVAEYDLGELTAVEPLPAGTSRACKVVTTRGSFVLKPCYRAADVEAQARVAGLLTARGIRQAAIPVTRAGLVVARSGWFLQEFLPGSVTFTPNRLQASAAMRHAGAYHLALGALPVRYQPDAGSLWSRVAEPDFLIETLPGLLDRYQLASDATRTALARLERARAGLAALPRQLVHGDIGPDNVLMDGDAVVSLIDFTPHLRSVLFAAASALYWYHVYGAARVHPADLRTSMAELGSARPWTNAELAVWPAALVLEALRRLATPLEIARQASAGPGPLAAGRLAAVDSVVQILPALSGEQ
jgi:Ser/Thr protein kinase RdoA (MazF antagonist)